MSTVTSLGAADSWAVPPSLRMMKSPSTSPLLPDTQPSPGGTALPPETQVLSGSGSGLHGHLYLRQTPAFAEAAFSLAGEMESSKFQPLLDGSAFSNVSAYGADFNHSYFNSSGLNHTAFSSGNDSSAAMETLVLSDGAKAALIVLYSLTTLLSISGNVLVVLVFTRGRRCRTDIRPFLINLAVADLVMALFCMPFTFTFVMMKTWVFSKPMCPVVLFVQHLSVSASVFTNMAIGSDRFLVVMFPLRSRVTTDRAKYVLVTIWLCAVALSSVQLFVGRASEWPDGLGGVIVTCDEVWTTPSARRTFTMFVLFITYIIPLTILAVAYTIVGILLWRRATPGNADQTRDMHQLKAKRKVVKMLILVVTMFGVCWLPLHTFFLVIDFNPELMNYESLEEERFFVALYYSVHWLAMSNSFANPVIYSFTNDSFRTDLAYIFYVVFPFCKCLKKLANRQLSMSMRDHRMHSTFRHSPAHSPYPGRVSRVSRGCQRQRKLYNGSRVYLALGQDGPVTGERTMTTSAASPFNDCSASRSVYDGTTVQTASTCV